MKKSTREKGAILLFVIGAVLLITVMGILLIGLVVNYESNVRAKADKIKAQYLAEAGVYRSIWELYFTRYSNKVIAGGVTCDGNVNEGESNKLSYYDNRSNTDLIQDKNPSWASDGKFTVEFNLLDSTIKSTGEHNGFLHSYMVKIEKN